jgi:hypothetical protein
MLEIATEGVSGSEHGNREEIAEDKIEEWHWK